MVPVTGSRIIYYYIWNIEFQGWRNLLNFAPLEWDWKIANGTLPLTFIWLSMMAASNICLRYSEVTFYQVVRALTILWSLIFQRIQFPEFVVGWERGVACIIVMIGFTIGSYGEINFHWIGFFSGLLSSVLVAYYNNSIKKALSFVDQSSWRLMIYNTTIAIPIFIPILYFTDELIINNEVAYQKLSPIVWQGIILSGVLGYLINLAIFLQIQLTSPLTGTISGTVKGVLQVLFGWLIFRNEISIMNGFGIILVLVGSTYYSWIGYRTSAQKQLDQELKDGDKEKGAV